MNKGEFMTRFNEWVGHRWPAWQVSAFMPSDWFAAVGRYHLATLTTAMKRHKVDGDPSRPRWNKVHSIACNINTAHHGPALGTPNKVIGTRQFSQKVRTNSGREKRVGLMKQQIKFDLHAHDTDPGAYGWLVHGTSAHEPAGPRPPP